MDLMFGRLFASCFLLWTVISYLRDLHFYWRKGWNFDEDHPGFNIYPGEDYDCQEPLSNKSRIFVGWPFFVFVSGILTIGSFSVDHWE